METFLKQDGTKPLEFSHIYDGKFVDRNKQIKTAGILTYSSGDNVETSIQQNDSENMPTNVQKFRNYTSPGLGLIRVHYGHADDSKAYEKMAHGVKSAQNSITSKDCVNPRVNNRFEQLRHEMNERIYSSNHSAPQGRVPVGVVPRHISASATFGLPSRRGLDSAKECLNPNKPRHQVELESSDKHDMYVYSHDDYEPGEQIDRVYSSSFDRYKRFGEITNARYDGKYARDSLDWTLSNNPRRITRTDRMLLDGFREKHTSQVGKVLDSNKDTLTGPDHIFGLINQSDSYTAGDVIHYRPEDKTKKGKDRERAYLATIRSNLARFNYVKFKTLAEAFDFYDKDKDGFISKDELKIGCVNAGFPIAENLLNLVLNECDYDHDGKIGFLEFCNFLCYKDSMNIGISKKSSETNLEFKRNERYLLHENDLVDTISQKKNVPRTLVNQIDEKVGSWKTTYNIMNDAPYRLEPLKKRVYGIPSIRTDILPPAFKKIQDKTNYGNDGNAWSLLVPSVLSQHGVYESDVLKPRSKSEIESVIKNSGIDLSMHEFEQIWTIAQRTCSSNTISVEDFRQAQSRFQGKA